MGVGDKFSMGVKKDKLGEATTRTVTLRKLITPIDTEASEAKIREIHVNYLQQKRTNQRKLIIQKARNSTNKQE